MSSKKGMISLVVRESIMEEMGLECEMDRKGAGRSMRDKGPG